MDWPHISSDSQTRTLSLSGSNSPIQNVPIYIWIEPGQMNAPGALSDTVTVNLYKGTYSDGGVPTKLASGKLTINVEITNQIELTIGDQMVEKSTGFEVKFERLVENEIAIYDVFVHSNRDYTLVLESKNSGQLAHDIQTVPTKINYSTFIDNKQIYFTESSSSVELDVKPAYASTKKQHKVKLILGPVGHAFKGDYSDRIILKAIPKD